MTAKRARRIGVEYSPHIIGGTETFLRSLFAQLDAERYTPVAIASAPGRWQKFLTGVVETRVVPYANPDGSPNDLAAALRELDLDLVQSSYFSPALAFAATKIGLPNIWRLGGHVDALDRQWGEGEKAQLLNIVCMLSRRIVCGSRFLQSQFSLDDRNRVEVIRNGFDLAALPPLAPSTSAAPPRVAMVAHLVPQKRHPIFLRAAAAVADRWPEARFFIFGGTYKALSTPGLDAYERSLRSLADDLLLTERLEIRELRTDRFATMAEMDVYAAPGVEEGASNAIVEAMALAKPVVAVASGGNPELIEDGVTGRLVAADDADALADALGELVGNPTLRAQIGRAARAHVESELSMADCARRYEDLYDQALAEER